jgi:DNA segregation ATPase FtsK/SpoIIIE, S-DNA-T family
VNSKSSCSKSTSSGTGWLVAVAILAAGFALYLAVRFVLENLIWFAAPASGIVVGRLAVAVGRFARLEQKRHWLPARWHRFGWHRLARNLGLAYVDKHLGGIDSGRKPKVVYPRVRFWPDRFGWLVPVRLPPAVNREDFERKADHLANSWGCARVGITQPRPGRLLLHAVRRDPLLEVVSPDVLPPFDGRHITLGRDEWGASRSVDLANLSGSVIAGNPGRGKTESATSLAVQLVPSPAVRFHVLDGGASDWAPWRGAAVSYVDDSLADAEDLLLSLHSGMMTRRRNLEADLGTRNAWAVGPTVDYPLNWLLIEEASWFFDLESAKGDRERERKVRACRGLAVQLLRRGRSPLYHTTLVVQKPTGTGGLPPDLRDLCGLRWCFGVATTETASAALGDDIRQYESMSPTLLQGEEHVGIATVLLKSGTGQPYTLVKFPAIGDLADRVARQAAERKSTPQDRVEVPA